MYEMRPRESLAIKTRQPRPMIEVMADNRAIPLDVDWTQRWCTLPKSFESQFFRLFNFEVRDDDVFVVTFPKCGTTWMQETVWLLMNNLDYEAAKRTGLTIRSPFLELTSLYEQFDGKSNDQCETCPSPRLIKSHFPTNLLPKQAWEKQSKIIYVARNVKDVVVSSYHFVKGMKTWSGTMDEYIEDFMNNDIMYTPYLSRLVDFWQMRNEPFIFFVTYEEMKRDIVDVIKKLCKFLNRPQLSDEELRQLTQHLSFDNMKNNTTVNLGDYIKTNFDQIEENFEFMRRGVIGSFKDELTPEQRQKLDQWSHEYLSKYGVEERDIFGKI